MKQLIWALVTIAGTLSSVSAEPIEAKTDNHEHHISAQTWTEITGLPGQLSDSWELVETDLSTIWLLRNQNDPNLLGRISAQQLEDSVQLKDEADAIAESFKFQSATLQRSTKTYGDVVTEQLEISTKDDEQDISGIFVLIHYENKFYTLLLTSHYNIDELNRYKDNLMNDIFTLKR